MTEENEVIDEQYINTKARVDAIISILLEGLKDYRLPDHLEKATDETKKSIFIAKELANIIWLFFKELKLDNTRHHVFSVCMIWYFIEENLIHCCNNVNEDYIVNIRKDLKNSFNYIFKISKFNNYSADFIIDGMGEIN